jgi:acetyl-CoA C-acetyltransferase
MSPANNPDLRPVYLVDGCRTPFLKARGTPGPFSAADLAVLAGRPLLARQPFDPGRLDEVVLGCVAPAADELNIARLVALRMGCGERVPAWTVQRNCASGLQAIDSAAGDIAAGRAELVLAGGTEAMSHAAILWGRAVTAWLGTWRQARTLGARARALARLRPSFLAPTVALLQGLTDPMVGLSMGQTAEHLAWRFRISRAAMDAFALRSHQRLGAAVESGALDRELLPIWDRDGRRYDRDDGHRPDSDLATLGRLAPAFDRPDGTVTAGNSAQVSDGAALVLLASEAACARHGLTALARLRDCRWSALDPAQMGLGPVHAATALLDAAGLTTADIDHWEINEAFAAQVLACLNAWADPGYRAAASLSEATGAIPQERLNPQGGAIALGHPVGASGARLVLHLALSLNATGAHRGVASLCIGGGQGGAMLVERAA